MKRKRTTDRMQRRRRGVLASLLMLVALGAFVLAGCGGSSGTGTEAGTNASATTGSGESAGGETGESATGAPGALAISDEAQKCLKEQGVEMPEFGGGAGGPPSGGEAPEGGELPSGAEPPSGAPSQGGMPEGGTPPGGAANLKKMEKAFKACGIEMQGKPGAAGNSGAPGRNTAAFKKQVKEYVACVRENGYELPEPNLSGEGPVFDESKVDQESSAFKKASAQCQSLLGGGESSGETSSGGV